MFARLVGWLAANAQLAPMSVAVHATFNRARSKFVMSLIVYHVNWPSCFSEFACVKIDVSTLG
ncbi:Uncharacterised protein [Burkholderia pseudomallei]|nr:Uncharacterised protein [Burkholderia pseudomallei]